MTHIDIISASAGSGKTYRLAQILDAEVTAGRVRPEAVLATTFTNKAAAELQERVRVRLLAAGKISEAQRLTAARIGTVNAICGRLVGDFAFELGLSPQLQVLDENLSSQALRKALSDVLTNDEEKELAGLTERLAEFDWQQVVQKIVDLARSNGIVASALADSARRSHESFAALLGEPHKDAAAEDAALVTALDAFIRSVDKGTDTTKATATARETVENNLRRLRSGFKLRWKDWVALAKLASGKGSNDAAEGVRVAASQQDCHPQLAQDVTRAIKLVFGLAERTLEAYQGHKRELGALDFVDQERLALLLLGQEHVQQQLKEELDLVLVNEFQDTSPIQLAIFLKLAEIAPRSIWVGDQKQAIYGFRGADPALMDASIEEILLGKEPETLPKSYRSRRELVEFTSDLFAPAFEFRGIPQNRVRLKSGIEDPPNDMGEIVECWTLDGKNKAANVAAVADGVRQMLADLVLVRDGNGVARKIRAGDIAVLCKTNDTCRNLATELAALGIQAVVPRSGLVTTLEGRVVIAGLRLWVDDKDRLAAAELARLVAFAGREEQWFHAVLEKPAAEAFIDLPDRLAIQQAREVQPKAGALAVFDAVVEAIGARQQCRRWGNTVQRLANLEALRGHAVTYIQSCTAQGMGCTPAGLIACLSELAADGADSQGIWGDENAVVVSTWHSAKGLEWPVTVLFELQRRDFDTVALGTHVVTDQKKLTLKDPLGGRWLRYWPNPYDPKNNGMPFHARLAGHEATRIAKDKAEREDLRLLYVGWTRARDRVVLAAREGNFTNGMLGLLKNKNGPLVSEPDADTLQWAGCKLKVKRRQATAQPSVLITPVPADNYVEAGPRSYPPAFVRPSDGDSSSKPAEDFAQIHERLPVSGDPEWSALGNALHGFLCVDRPEMDPARRLVLAEEILTRWGVLSALNPSYLLTASDAFYTWVGKQWPDAAWHREWPVHQRLDDGSVMRGASDLVLETATGCVVIDHKSFPGSIPQALQRAAGYEGQLRLYTDAIALATGKPVRGCFIHMPVLGIVVPISL